MFWRKYYLKFLHTLELLNAIKMINNQNSQLQSLKKTCFFPNNVKLQQECFVLFMHTDNYYQDHRRKKLDFVILKR